MTISIERVLQHFDTTVDDFTHEVKSYFIRFITADGRLRTMQARKLTRAPKQQLQQPLSARGGVQYNLKRNGVIMMEDISSLQPRAVKVAMISHFKQNNSNDWLNVIH